MPMNGTLAARAQRARRRRCRRRKRACGRVDCAMRSRPSGCGLVVHHVLHADHGIEDQRRGEAVQRELGFGARAAGEDGEAERLGQLLERARLRDPFLAQIRPSVPCRGRASESALHVFERDVDAGLRDHVVRELPVVVPAALVLVVLDLLARDRRAGEVLDRLRDGLAVGFGDVHQDAVHVEYDQRLSLLPDLFQRGQQARASARACRR